MRLLKRCDLDVLINHVEEAWMPELGCIVFCLFESDNIDQIRLVALIKLMLLLMQCAHSPVHQGN